MIIIFIIYLNKIHLLLHHQIKKLFYLLVFNQLQLWLSLYSFIKMNRFINHMFPFLKIISYNLNNYNYILNLTL